MGVGEMGAGEIALNHLYLPSQCYDNANGAAHKATAMTQHSLNSIIYSLSLKDLL